MMLGWKIGYFVRCFMITLLIYPDPLNTAYVALPCYTSRGSSGKSSDPKFLFRQRLLAQYIPQHRSDFEVQLLKNPTIIEKDKNRRRT